MKGRVRIVSMQPFDRRPNIPEDRPEGVNQDQWTMLLRREQEFHARLEQELSDNIFGKPLPFSRIPEGTIPLKWAQVDGGTTFEVDVSPNTEEGLRLVGIYHLEDVGRLDLEKAGIIRAPEGTNIIAIQIGGLAGTHINPVVHGGLAYDLAVKFWIFADNVTQETSQLLHVEIPDSYEDINCTNYPTYSKVYKELEKRLSIS